jgi:hypothetical protein
MTFGQNNNQALKLRAPGSSIIFRNRLTAELFQANKT